MASSIVLTFIVVFNTLAGDVGAQPQPITVDADAITYDAAQRVVTAQGNVRITLRRYRLFSDAVRYDLRTEIIVATGRIRLVDPEGRELRGQSLTYNTRTEEGVLEPAEGFLERRVYVRGRRLDVAPTLYIAHESIVTTCDPQRPLYRIVARRIEIVPEKEIVAYHASLYLRDRRLITLPRYVVSLRPPEVGTQFPGFGVNAVDGFWVDYRFPVLLPRDVGEVHVKYGTRGAAVALVSLTRSDPAFSATLRLGRTQTVDERQAFGLLRYDVAEVGIATTPVRIASSPFSWTFSAAAGWHGEQATRVATWRLDGQVAVSSDTIPLGSRLGFAAGAAYRASSYGTGALRTVTSLNASLAYQVDRFTDATLAYSLVVVRGATPFSIDNVGPANTLSLGLVRTVPDRYRFAASVAHDFGVPETKLSGSLNIVVARQIEVGVSAVHNARLSAFEDIDYTVRWICDCIDVVLRYRQVRREVSLEFGIMGFPERGAPFVPRSTPPPGRQGPSSKLRRPVAGPPPAETLAAPDTPGPAAAADRL